MSRNKSVLIIAIFCLATSCIPLRKQYYLIDDRKPTLSAIQKTDTVIYTVPFEYKMRKGDNLSISVANLQFDAAGGLSTLLKTKSNHLQNSNTSNQNDLEGYQINDSGYVNLPFIGSIQMAGLTLEEAESKINKIASKYFNHTITNIRVGFTYTLVLINSGSLRTSLTSKLTLLEVITQSTIPEFGNLRKIKIIRRTDDNTGYHIYYVDINNQSIVSKPEFYILPNDIIVVEAYRLKNFTQYFVRNYGLVSTFISLPLLFFSLLNTFRRN